MEKEQVPTFVFPIGQSNMFMFSEYLKFLDEMTKERIERFRIIWQGKMDEPMTYRQYLSLWNKQVSHFKKDLGIILNGKPMTAEQFKKSNKIINKSI